MTKEEVGPEIFLTSAMKSRISNFITDYELWWVYCHTIDISKIEIPDTDIKLNPRIEAHYELMYLHCKEEAEGFRLRLRKREDHFYKRWYRFVLPTINEISESWITSLKYIKDYTNIDFNSSEFKECIQEAKTSILEFARDKSVDKSRVLTELELMELPYYLINYELMRGENSKRHALERDMMLCSLSILLDKLAMINISYINQARWSTLYSYTFDLVLSCLESQKIEASRR